MQIINFINHFFLVSMQRSRKLYTMGNLSMAGYTDLKCWYQIEKTFGLLSACRKSTPCFPWDIAKILQTCYFGYFGHAWLCPPNMILSTCRERLCLSAAKKPTSSPHFSRDIAMICKFLILGSLGMSNYALPKW